MVAREDEESWRDILIQMATIYCALAVVKIQAGRCILKCV